MRPPPVLLILLLCLVVLAGCEQRNVAPLAQALFPTATPTLVPSPTPTRVDEVVIPFESVAVNQLQADLPTGVNAPDITAQSPIFQDEQTEVYEPQVFILSNKDQLAEIQMWLPEETVRVIAGIDFQQLIVIAFFEALSPASDGYIERIGIGQNSQITVYAVLRQFSSATGEVTFPSHIVTVRRQDIPFPVSEGTSVKLETETRIIN
jgi:hypothetical protein